MSESKFNPRSRNSVTLTPSTKEWLKKQLDFKKISPADIASKLQGKLSSKTVYDVFNPQSVKSRFDKRSIFLVADAIEIPQVELLSVLNLGSLDQNAPPVSSSPQSGFESEWNTVLANSKINQMLGITEVGFVTQWSGLTADRVEFQLDTTVDYEARMPDSVRTLMDALEPGWQLHAHNFGFRLESITKDERKNSNPGLVFRISLIPSTLYRVAPGATRHPRLRDEMLAECFNNTLNCFKVKSYPLLPSFLALRMAVLTSDNKLIIEGEDPEEGGKREVGYRKSPSADFYIENCNNRIAPGGLLRPHWSYDLDLKRCTLCGIVVERDKLMPILVGVYHAVEPFEELKGIFAFANTNCRLDSADVDPHEIGIIWKELGPVSQIAAACALITSAKSPTEADGLLRRLSGHLDQLGGG